MDSVRVPSGDTKIDAVRRAQRARRSTALTTSSRLNGPNAGSLMALSRLVRNGS